MSANKKHVLLIGGGHAHVAVLADWIKHGLPADRATLLTPHPTLRYSGMVPGWISGQYDRDAGLVDIASLARQAGVELVLDWCAVIDPHERIARTRGDRAIAFDIASIDTGGTGRAQSVLGDDPRMIDVRPIDRFVEQFAAWQLNQSGPAKIGVIGGGPGGVELAFALRNREGASGRSEVCLVTGSDGLLPEMSRAVRSKVLAELERQQISVITENAVIRNEALVAGGISLEPVGLIVAALGSAAPEWPGQSGLECDADGLIAVDEFQRSVSHPHMLAVGDVARRMDIEVAHSGVHAVYAGPVLAQTLRAILDNQEPRSSYRPRGRNLYLMSTGNGSAIASYGHVAAQGRWMGRLKHWIDTRWIAKYARLGGNM
ncbi:FAD-dependent oxidoreductase [Erythrobacter ani]|uniref:FAD-dependent oxidoreductase n=1 Tax=Erythrobacter ani TaxID=2827235 RepID=UPI0021043F20|nr:FAD-dependent oxidoreductase [Erythrobacter ani]